MTEADMVRRLLAKLDGMMPDGEMKLTPYGEGHAQAVSEIRLFVAEFLADDDGAWHRASLTKSGQPFQTEDPETRDHSHERPQ